MPPINRPDWELAHREQLIACVIFGVAALSALVYMAVVARKDRSPWPLYLFLGCGLSVFYEPINNVLGHCTYPEIHQLTWITTFGREIPVYIGLVYFFYFSASVLFVMQRIRAGITANQWWKYYGVFTVLVTCFEFIPISRGWWMYYGDNQALRVLGFPMWWWVLNSYCLFGTATVLHHVQRRLRLSGHRSALLVVLYPMVLVAFHATAAIPVFTTLNSSASLAVNTFGTLATMGLGLLGVWAVSHWAIGQGKQREATAPRITATGSPVDSGGSRPAKRNAEVG